MKKTFFLATYFLTLVFAAGWSSPLQAQELSPRDELLGLVPIDCGFCLVVQDLRGHIEKYRQAPWIQSLLSSPLGKALANAPEMQQLKRIEEEVKKRLDLDLPTLRDDILGDAVVFAYRPPLPGNPDHEQGMVLVRARRADLLTRITERINQEQKRSGDLKELIQEEYKGVRYQRRVDQRSTRFLLITGNILVFAGKENLIHGVIDRKKDAIGAEKSLIAQQIQQAGAGRDLAALWVNPQVFVPELEQRAQKDSGPDALVVRTFLAYWKPMEAIVIALGAEEDLHLKLVLQARTKDLPPSARKVFLQPSQVSDLWNRFPSRAILTLANRVDVSSLAESFSDFSTPENRQMIVETLQKTAGAALGLNLVKEVLPNLGPDWGLCLAAAEDPAQFPHVLAALAVKPGSGDVPVDQALVKGLQFLADLVIFDHNRKHADPLRLKSVKQDQVEVKYIVGTKVFPAGLQPAWALKDGYLVLASSPDAILRFKDQGSLPEKGTGSPEAPILRLSSTELAKLLRQRRQDVIDHLAEKNQIPKALAGQQLQAALGLLDLVDHITLSQTSGNGQLTWTLRIRPKNP